ncbi:MAG: hypothetical protein ABI609_02530 [Acidobacteriota bacterium]
MRSTKSRSWTDGAFGRLLGFAPVPPPPHVFALEATRLRYAGFTREAEGLRLVDARESALPPDAFQHGPLGGPLRDAGAFTELVTSLLQRVAAPVKDASLLIPDAWLRVTSAESGDLPRQAAGRDDLLRWRLKHLVPFRIDDLRVSGEEVEPFPGQQEPRRLLLGFAGEALLAQLEDAFAAAGIHLGAISNPSLSLAGALRVRDEAGLTAIVLVDGASYTLLFTRPTERSMEPVLHRYKAWTGDPSVTTRAALVGRDMRLTRAFLEENLPGVGVRQALLWMASSANAAGSGDWLSWLAEGLGCPARLLGAEHLRVLPGGLPGALWGSAMEAAPMLGAACREVA